jgi:hypothetical protein
MDREIIDAIENYYKLKSLYENKKKIEYEKLKGRMTSKEYTHKKMKKEVSKLNYQCVNCKRKVNSKFIIKDNKLIALCGDSKTPCNLNIEIEKGTFDRYDNLKNETLDNINKFKEQIFKIKLELIFKLKSEDYNFALFKKVKNALNDEYGDLIIFNDILHNLDQLYDNNEIKGKTTKYLEYIQAIDIMKINYRKENNAKYLKEAVDIYVQNIIPLIDELYELKYNTNRVEQINGTPKYYKYIQQKYNYYQTEINNEEEPKIISNVYRN